MSDAFWIAFWGAMPATIIALATLWRVLRAEGKLADNTKITGDVRSIVNGQREQMVARIAELERKLGERK